MIFGDIAKAIFGDKGITGGVMDVLKSTGIIKDPETALKAEQALRDFELAKANQDIEVAKIEAGDRASARDMQKESLKQDDVFSKRFIYYYALGMSGAAILYIGLATFINIPEKNVRFVDTVLGFFLGTLLAAIIQFFFGSSSGSMAKSQQIEKMIEKK